jgi:hypothetical protein
MSDDPAKNWWVSWWCPRDQLASFELHSPWWISGERIADGAQSICAAVQAATEDRAKALIGLSYDEPKDGDTIEWRFINEQPDDWSPFNDRFQRAHWMQWDPLARNKETP